MTTPNNTCGECRACCIHLPIAEQELQKPAGIPCKYLCATGCGIWQQTQMPKLCRTYLCGWRRDAWLGKREYFRPDRLGVIVEPSAVEDGEKLVLTEVAPGAFEAKHKQIAFIKTRYPGAFVKLYPLGVLDGINVSPSEIVSGLFDGTKYGLYFEERNYREVVARRR